jgi:vault protein inter-alpha-trypsin-like protein
MSSPKSATSSVRFEPVMPATSPAPSAWLLVLGVIYPTVVIAIELATRMCAESLFDPMPTYGHTLAVALVPAGNLLFWCNRRNNEPRRIAWLQFANGLAIAVAGFYTLLFSPLLAVAILVAVVGIGLLPLAPLAAFACALWLRRSIWKRCGRNVSRWPWLGGVASGLVLLLVLDIPAAATRLGMQWAASGVASERERGLALLRVLGDDDLLLRLCYDAVGRPTGLLSALVLFGGSALLEPRHRQLASSPEEAREIYYRVHGVPFNAKPVPFDRGRWSRLGDFQFDHDHGASAVGGRVKGLEIAASRLDGSIDGDDAVAYLEWTMELRNNAAQDREVRLQLALPPGGVVSRATLWVNGEEREAAYAGRGEVRAAYRQVAVQQRRDPLLVTSKGADRILAQAFPVPRGGGSLKFKIGISAPLQIETASAATLTLPAVIDRNFSFPAGAGHSVWIESKQALAAPASGLVVGRSEGGSFRIAGSLEDRQLSGARPAVRVQRNAEARALISRLGDGEFIMQEIMAEEAQPSAAVMLVIDGSARLKATVAPLLAALDTVAPSTRVGAILATEPVRWVTMAPWSAAQKQAIGQLLLPSSFVGGQDNAPALADAIAALEAEPNARLLWIHGPQPVSFRGSAARLEQAIERLSRLPRVTLYAVEAGPNELLPDVPWAWSARTLPYSGSPAADLSAFLAHATGKDRALSLRRSQVDAAAALLPRGSDHVARLWARERVLELMQADPTANRAAAVALAAPYRLVTPVSGAVVLESRQQYEENGLTPASQATVPTVPEPHEWALIIVALVGLGWLMWRQWQQPTAVA